MFLSAFCSHAPIASAFDAQAAFTGTIVSLYPDGRKANLWIDQDGTWRGQNWAAEVSSGKWKVSGEKVCFKQHRPIAIPFSYCTKMPERLDQDWVAKAVTGEPIKLSLVNSR
jgi:hypothetical protein